MSVTKTCLDLITLPTLSMHSAKKNRKKVITPDDINSLFADKKPVEEEEEEEEDDDEDESALGGSEDLFTNVECCNNPRTPVMNTH